MSITDLYGPTLTNTSPHAYAHAMIPPSYDATARLIARWERVLTAFLVVLTILLSTSAFYYLFVTGGREEILGNKSASDNPVYMLVWMLLYLGTAMAFTWSVLTRGLRPGLLGALPLVALVLVSGAWSVSTGTTMFYGIMFAMNVLGAYVISQMVHPARFLRILGLTLLVCLVASCIMLVFLPERSIATRWGGGWVNGLEFRGVFSHKSDAGYYFAILFVIMLAGRSFGIGRWTRLFGCVAVLLTMPLTNSATGVVALVSLSALLLISEQMPRVQSLMIASAAAIVIMVSVVLPFIDLGAIPQLVGRDAGLTGRGDIWNSGKEFVALRPIFGYGYYGFFDRDTFSPVWELWGRSEYFNTPHFHNAALDLTVSLGILGLAMYVVTLCFAFTVLVNQTLANNTRVMIALILLAFVISAAFDFTLMKHNHFATFFMFYAFFVAQTRYTPNRRTGSNSRH